MKDRKSESAFDRIFDSAELHGHFTTRRRESQRHIGRIGSRPTRDWTWPRVIHRELFQTPDIPKRRRDRSGKVPKAGIAK